MRKYLLNCLEEKDDPKSRHKILFKTDQHLFLVYVNEFLKVCRRIQGKKRSNHFRKQENLELLSTPILDLRTKKKEVVGLYVIVISLDEMYFVNKS